MACRNGCSSGPKGKIGPRLFTPKKTRSKAIKQLQAEIVRLNQDIADLTNKLSDIIDVVETPAIDSEIKNDLPGDLDETTESIRIAFQSMPDNVKEEIDNSVINLVAAIIRHWNSQSYEDTEV